MANESLGSETEADPDSDESDSDGERPGFWATGAKPWKVSMIKPAILNTMPKGKEDVVMASGRNEVSFVLFDEPRDITIGGAADVNVTTNNLLGVTTLGEERDHPCDVTINEALANAMAVNSIGRYEYFTVPPPKRHKPDQGTHVKKSAVKEGDDTEPLSISQSSLTKELEEIHERVVVAATQGPTKEVPIKGSTFCKPSGDKKSVSVCVKQTQGRPSVPSANCVAEESGGKLQRVGTPQSDTSEKPPGINMGTQTQPNVIPDLPVLKSEFDSQMETLERSLTDQDWGVRSNEIWRAKNERKVDRIDAEYHHQMKLLQESNNEMVSDMKTLKSTVKSLNDKIDLCKSGLAKDNSISSGTDTPDSKRMRKDSGNVATTKRAQPRTVSTPVRRDNLTARKVDQATLSSGMPLYTL